LKSTSILDTIGRTPLVKIRKITSAPIYAKAEFLNPSGSVKDRVALYMIEQAEKKGLLKPDSIIVEPSSGNTGIGLAFVGVQKGYRVRIIMPGNMSEERKKIIRAFGGEVVSTSEKESLEGAIRKAEAMRQEDDRVYVPQQFENPANPEIHYKTTAVEIWEQTNGEISAFVAGVGSGGTLAGVGRFLKEKNRGIHLVAVEPANSAALLGHEPGLHQIQGIGDGFVPKILDVSIIDDVVTVSDEEAINATRQLAREEGLLVGTSSGANIFASMKISKRLHGNIITILPDRAERYFSTSLI